MRILVVEFISLDGVVQAPGGPDEDTEGGFLHGGWTAAFFDELAGAAFDEAVSGAEALLFGGGPGRRWRPRGPAGRATPSPTG